MIKMTKRTFDFDYIVKKPIFKFPIELNKFIDRQFFINMNKENLDIYGGPNLARGRHFAAPHSTWLDQTCSRAGMANRRPQDQFYFLMILELQKLKL